MHFSPTSSLIFAVREKTLHFLDEILTFLSKIAFFRPLFVTLLIVLLCTMFRFKSRSYLYLKKSAFLASKSSHFQSYLFQNAADSGRAACEGRAARSQRARLPQERH